MRIAKKGRFAYFGARLCQSMCPSGMSCPGKVAVQWNIVKVSTNSLNRQGCKGEPLTRVMGGECPLRHCVTPLPEGEARMPQKKELTKMSTPTFSINSTGRYYPLLLCRAQLRIANSQSPNIFSISKSCVHCQRF